MPSAIDQLSNQLAPSPSHPSAHGGLKHDFTNEAAAGAVLLLLLLVGAAAMLPVVTDLTQLWHDDPLRSFGALLPFVSFALVGRAWRQQNWASRGTALGLVPLVAAILLARTYNSFMVAYHTPTFEIAPVQPGLLCFLYGSGIVLLLGGVRLWRAALLPLCLLLCVNPVPHLFERIDFPLQTISANTARGFAHLLGLQPSGEQLRMLFAPSFGMVIVPGCDGVRGSATMIYLALLIGYVRRMGWLRTAALMVLGLVTGYLLNLARLCTLVLYYWVGIHFPRLRGDGELIDYCIGGALFLLVCFGAGFLLFRPMPGADALEAHASPARHGRVQWAGVFHTVRWWVAGTLCAAAALTVSSSAWKLLVTPGRYISVATAQAALPERTGAWTRGEQWEEISNGNVVWLWTAYRRIDGTKVDLAVWLSPKRHYAIQSRFMNGSKPLLGEQISTRTADVIPVDLSTFTLQDDLVEHSLPIPTFFAETLCLPTHCNVQESGFRQTGWIITSNPIDLRVSRRLPLLFRVQATPGGQETEENRAQARRIISEFIQTLALQDVSEKLGAR